jgi:peroxiredoxin
MNDSGTTKQQSRQSLSEQRKGILQPGVQAPDFCLKATPDQKVGLQDFSNQPVILLFYPADWSPVCGDELGVFNEVLSEFQNFNAALVGISVDNVWSHIAFSKQNKFKYPLLSDFEPKGKTAQDYGVYDAEEGVCKRAIFLVDGKGMIRWSYLSPIGVSPGADGILKALESLEQTQQKGVA